jgi:hypothetical protein
MRIFMVQQQMQQDYERMHMNIKGNQKCMHTSTYNICFNIYCYIIGLTLKKKSFDNLYSTFYYRLATDIFKVGRKIY